MSLHHITPNNSKKNTNLTHISEAATGGVLLKKVLLEISQISQENSCGLQLY